MSVYIKEKAEHLQASMDSIWNQTVKTDDFILVCDGPLDRALDGVIEKMEDIHPELHVIRIEKNGGLGNALNTGLRVCKNELVARMDSDDISRPDRCEKQLDVFQKHPDVSLVSGTVEEFTVSADQVEVRRALPEQNEEIVEFARTRNPFNHPCIMYRKSAVEDAGGYQDFYLLEDYYLWIRMLQKGCRGYNLQTPLLWMRAGAEMYQRRGGWKYAKSQQALFAYMKKTGFITGFQYVKNVTIRGISSVSPNWLRTFMFKRLLRTTG